MAVALVADSFPDRGRAPALGLLQSVSTWGNLAAALIGMALGALAARHLLPLGLKHWQAMFLVGTLPAGSGMYYRALEGPGASAFTVLFRADSTTALPARITPRLSVIRIR